MSREILLSNRNSATDRGYVSLALYQSLGLQNGYDYVRTEHAENVVKFYLAAREDQFVCPDCGGWEVFRKGKRFVEAPAGAIGSKPAVLVIEVPRLQCAYCGEPFEHHRFH